MAALVWIISIFAFKIAPLSSLVSTYDVIISADYENGNETSGISGLIATHAPAVDAAYIAAFGRNSAKSICHKAVLNDTTYWSSSACRSESDTLAIEETRYTSGTEFIYKFSLYLQDWQDYISGAAPIDIIWQFKHTQGGPDAMLGVKRNSLVLRYGEGSGQANIVSDVRPFDNQWIDVEAHIKWEDTETGFIRIMAQTPNDNTPVEVFNVDNFKTFTDNGSGDFGYLKYGLYRPDSTSDNNYNERVACHDNVQIIKVAHVATSAPTVVPTTIPTNHPTTNPTTDQTNNPTSNLSTRDPTNEPTFNPVDVAAIPPPSSNPTVAIIGTDSLSGVYRDSLFFSMSFVFIIVCFL